MSGGSLRFAFLTTFYPPFNFGGDGVGVERLAHGLARRGHHVTVLHDVDAFAALNRGTVPVPRSRPEGVEVIGLRSGLGMLSPLLTQQLGRPVLQGRRIRRVLAEGRFDVVNFHNISLIGGPGLLRYGSGVKLYMAHEHWLVCPTHVLWRHRKELCPERACFRCQLAYHRPPQWWRATGALERALGSVDTFIAMSEFSRAKHKEFGFPRDMEVLPYFLPEECGEPPSPPPPEGARPYFLFVGRLEKIKGLQDVIPLFAGTPQAELLIAGDGEYGDVLRHQARGSPAIRFLGRVAPDALRQYYAHALALVVPSVGFETFGIILIEAFRQGLPVIARALGPFPEIVAKAGAGELFSTRDELWSAMERLRTDRTHRATLSTAARTAFQTHWSEDAVIPEYLKIVHRAAARRGIPLPQTLEGS